MLRVLLVDDHALFRRGLRRLVAEHGFDVVGEASNGEAGVRMAAELSPDVVVMDLHMPILSGVEATRRIRAVSPDAKVLMLTISEQEGDIVDALLAGASGYVLKDAEPEIIASALRATAEGESMISPAATSTLIQRVREQEASAQPAADAPADLTDREVEILRLVAEGLDNTDIADRLFLSPSTVKNHVSSILGKLGVEGRVQAAVLAVRSGLA
jgi:DNA-binding NarL/FixJ family response regulator